MDEVYGVKYYGSGDAVPWSAGTEDSNSVSTAFKSKDVGIRSVVILTCSLSVLGSLAIILSFACFRQLRSKPREILLHISIMDLGVSLANLLGAAVYFDQYYHTPAVNITDPADFAFQPTRATDEPPAADGDAGPVAQFSAPRAVEDLCVAQAFFAGFFTLGSVLWTVFLSVYIYFYLLFHKTRPQLPKRSLPFAGVLCYGLPLAVMAWLVSTGRLGYAPYNSSGWCTLIVQDPATGERDILAVVLGNDLWIYLAMLLIPIMYFASLSYLHANLDSAQRRMSRGLVYKFLFIPLIFLVLRLWTCILIILYTYIALPESQVPSGVNKTLLYLSGIGDSGQGLANAILFVLFSQKARKKVWRCLLCRPQVVDSTNFERVPTNNSNQRQLVDGHGQGVESASTVPQRDFEETTHLLFESLDNTSLLIEIDKSSRVI